MMYYAVSAFVIISLGYVYYKSSDECAYLLYAPLFIKAQLFFSCHFKLPHPNITL